MRADLPPPHRRWLSSKPQPLSNLEQNFFQHQPLLPAPSSLRERPADSPSWSDGHSLGTYRPRGKGRVLCGCSESCPKCSHLDCKSPLPSAAPGARPCVISGDGADRHRSAPAGNGRSGAGLWPVSVAHLGAVGAGTPPARLVYLFTPHCQGFSGGRG